MPENQNIEWKSKWKDTYLEWICGFANAQGGSIYIGCDDDGNVIGLKNYEQLLEDIPNKIRNAMSIVVDVNLLKKDNNEYIEIKVPPYPVAISCKGIYYYRSGSTMQTLTGPELESFILRKRGASWDNMPLPGFTIDDIDDELVEKFKKLSLKKGRIDPDSLSESKADLMEKLRLTNAGYYTNAAMLLFSKNPDKWQLGAYTKIGFFKNDADILYYDEIHGSILKQIDTIVEVMRLKYMKVKITYEGMQRIERYIVPESALREALLNAICHKQYESGIPIQISVYSDKIYIANCGKLPEDWTVSSLMTKHASRPYNPSIANVFYLAGYIESWGRGIERICSACKEDKSPLPVYTVNPGDIMIQFTAAKDRVVENFIDKVTEVISEDGDEDEKNIINLLMEDPAYTYDKLSIKLNLSRKTISGKIKKLKEKGILKRKGNDRKGYWKIIVK